MAKKQNTKPAVKETPKAETSSSTEGGMSKTTKIIIISVGVLILTLLIPFLILGRVRVIDNSMESTVAKGETLWFNKFSSPNYNDIVAFHHPETDSIVASAKDKNYYKMCRMYGESWVSKAELVKQDMHKRPIYLSRCVAVPGDVVEIQNNHLIVNKKESPYGKPAKQLYYVVTDGLINPAIIDTLGLSKTDLNGETDYYEDFLNIYRQRTKTYTAIKIFTLSPKAAKKLQQISVIKKIEPVVLPKDHFEPTVFPFLKEDNWNESNLGPLLVPKKDKIIKFSSTRVAEYYRRVIENYEGNTLQIKNGKVFINGKEANSYRFKQNYYFVIGDNRATKNDSRFFGFLPEDHVVGIVM